MRDNTRIWAGHQVIGDIESEPVVYEGTIGDCLMTLLQFVEGYSIGKGFVFTVARKESEVRSRLARTIHARGGGIRGESLQGVMMRLAQAGAKPASMSPDTGSLATTTTMIHQPDSFEDRSDDPDVQAMIRKALGEE